MNLGMLPLKLLNDAHEFLAALLKQFTFVSFLASTPLQCVFVLLKAGGACRGQGELEPSCVDMEARAQPIVPKNLPIPDFYIIFPIIPALYTILTTLMWNLHVRTIVG